MQRIIAIKFIVFCLLTGIFFSCSNKKSTALPPDIQKEKIAIAAVLDSFNVAAANAEYERYFKFFSSTATFNGTDATENWSKDAFMIWAKPYFEKKTTWHFATIKRNIYFGEQNNIAWFDELLNTQMKICRGSGVMVKQHNEWKIQQYVLSMAIPNSQSDAVIKLKSAEEDSLISVLMQQ